MNDIVALNAMRSEAIDEDDAYVAPLTHLAMAVIGRAIEDYAIGSALGAALDVRALTPKRRGLYFDYHSAKAFLFDDNADLVFWAQLLERTAADVRALALKGCERLRYKDQKKLERLRRSLAKGSAI